MIPGDQTLALEAIAESVSRSPLDVLEFFIERAAIREHLGGMLRADAEVAALGDVLGHFAPSPTSSATLPRPQSDSVTQDKSGCGGTAEDGSEPTTQATHSWRAP